jgi:CRISPR-associated endoribonuclease Cas6
MRLLARLEARMDAAYDNAYHHKLRGRIWNALEGTKFDDLHDQNRPKGFSYSGPFPYGTLREGDERNLLIASAHEELLTHVATNLRREPELNVGEMPFRVTDMSALTPDVGEPGTSGTIETGTGVVVRIPPWRFDDYGIDPDGDDFAFWRPEYTVEPFKQQLHDNLDKKHGHYCRDDLPGPTDVDGELFDEYELLKTYALPVTVAEGETQTYVVSKWRFDYRVRNDHHRRHLNLALDAGIGERNSLGFGFCNITDKTTVRGETPHAFS